MLRTVTFFVANAAHPTEKKSMKKSIAFILTTVLITLCVHPAFGQQRSRVPSSALQSNSQRTATAQQSATAVPVTVTPIDSTSSVPAVTVTSSSSSTPSPGASGVTVTTSSGELESANVNEGCVPNPTIPIVAFVPAQMVRTVQQGIYEALQYQLEQIRDALSATDVSPEILSAKLKEKGATPAQLAELIVAIENGEGSAVSRIWITLGGDPVEGSRISRTLNLLALVEEIESAVEEQEFSATDLKDFRRAFDRSKPGKETDKTVKKCLGAMDTLARILELSQNRPKKESQLNEMYAPGGDVTLLLNPALPHKVVMALDESVFVVGTREIKKSADDDIDVLQVAEGSLDDYLGVLPTSEAEPVASGTTSGLFTLKNTSEKDLNFTLGKDKKTLTAGETESYPFPDSGKAVFSVTKTRNASSGGRRGSTKPQSYQDTQELSITKGVTYDCTVESETITLSPHQVQITLDNKQNPYPFNLQVGGEIVSVPPGETQVIGKAEGIVTVRFARSADPNDIAVYEFSQTETYKPAIRSADGRWSLFSTIE